MLCLDIGNSHIYGGMFQDDTLRVQFRYPSTSACTSDQLGVFLKSVLRENGVDPEVIQKIGISSVVPWMDYSLQSAVIKYFSGTPFFINGTAKTGLVIQYKNPQEIGADRIANAMGAVHHYPEGHKIIVDMGTATTFDIISDEKKYISALIMPGLRTSMEALSENTAKLPPVNLIRPRQVMGHTTVENIQSGLYYAHLGSIREIIQRIKTVLFEKNGEQPASSVKVIGTGGFANLFEEENIFDAIVPDLILHGLRVALLLNT